MKCGRCQKVIRSKIDRQNFERYSPGFCSFNCQEWARLAAAQEAVRQLATQQYNDDPDGDIEGADYP
jgi:hypothetical protein